MTEQNMKICSFNCKGFKNRNYSYIKELSNKFDIILLQETWLHDFEIDKVNKIIPNFMMKATSSMDATDISRLGRPFGGCLIMWNKSLKVNVKSIPTTSNRICALEINNKKGIKLIIISIYMPVNDNSATSILTFGDTLSEVSSIINTYDEHKVIIGGDFNVDFNKDSINKDILTNFCVTENLTTEFHQFPNNISFTYESSTGNRSHIDHFIYSTNISDKITNVQCKIDGNNLSDHHPLDLCLKIDYDKSKETSNNASTDNTIKFNWKKTSQEYKILYSQILDEMLSNLEINDNAINCNNIKCSIHSEYIHELFEATINAMTTATEMTIPKINNNSKKPVPGWNSYVKPFKEKSIFWNDIWKSAGCPANGELASIRRTTKARYHQAIRYVKRNEDHIIKCNTSNHLNKKHFSQFWETIRKIKYRDNKSNPNIIDDISGDQNIANHFKDKYSTLYNSRKGISDNTYARQNVKISDKCLKNECHEKHNITYLDVKTAIKKLKKDKYDMIYNICTDNITNASNYFIELLAKIFNSMLIHGFSFNELNKSVIKPIIKNKRKCHSDSNNYRGIALSSLLLKLLEYIIINKIENNLNSSDYQFAYKREHSTIMCNFLLDQTIQYYLNNNTDVYCVFLDATKAFDLIDHEQLFKTLNDNGICPLFIRLIMVLYKFNNAVVQYNQAISSSFGMETGTKQGSVLSAYLFTLYMDNLVKALLSTNVGCMVGSKLINTLVYADDVVLIGPSVSAMKILLETCESFTKSHHVNFNTSKSSLLYFNKSKESNYVDLDLKLCGVTIPIKNEVNYLGTILKNDLQLHNADKCISDMKTRSNVIINEFSQIDSSARSKLFKSQAMSFYGCELFNLDDPYINKLLTAWRVCSRRILNVHRQTHCNLIEPLIQCKNPLLMIEQRILNFFRKMLNHDNQLVKFISSFTLSNNFSYMYKNLISILYKHSISYEKLYNNQSIKINENVSSNWKIPIIRELILIRDQLLHVNLNEKEIKELLKYLCTE